jgi:hypothetical protein
MIEGGLISVDGGIVSLTDKGRDLAKEIPAIPLTFTCRRCQGQGYIIPENFEKVAKAFYDIAEDRPLPIEEYDQGYMRPEDVLKRVALLYERGDLASRDILVIGDDDLFSIAASLTRLPSKVVVLEVDKRLVKFINKNAKENNLCVEARSYDVREPIDKEFEQSFDVFLCDPVETLEGIKLFLSRGVSSLRGIGSAGYFGLTTLEASLKKWYEIQRMLLDMGFVITDIKRKYSEYPWEDNNFKRYQEKLPIMRYLKSECNYSWYKSAFYRIECIKEPKPLVTGEQKIGDKFYLDDESWATPM